MYEATISVVDSDTLLPLFGPRDQHVRKIRSALGVSISARDGEILVEGDEKPVAQAAETIEHLQLVSHVIQIAEVAEIPQLPTLARAPAIAVAVVLSPVVPAIVGTTILAIIIAIQTLLDRPSVEPRAISTKPSSTRP